MKTEFNNYEVRLIKKLLINRIVKKRDSEINLNDIHSQKDFAEYDSIDKITLLYDKVNSGYAIDFTSYEIGTLNECILRQLTLIEKEILAQDENYFNSTEHDEIQRDMDNCMEILKKIGHTDE